MIRFKDYIKHHKMKPLLWASSFAEIRHKKTIHEVWTSQDLSKDQDDIHLKNKPNALSQDQKDALTQYSGNLASNINGHLRRPSIASRDTSELRESIRKLSSIFSNPRNTNPDPIKTWAGVPTNI